MLRRFVALIVVVLLATRVVSAADDVQRIYAVRVNGQAVSTGSILLERPDGTLLVAEDDLIAWGFELKARTPSIVRNQIPYYALADFTGLKTNLDVKTQTLEIEAAPDLFVPTRIRLPGLLGGQPTFTRGAYLNYDLDTQHVAGGNSTSNLFSLGYTGLPGGGVVVNRFDEIGGIGRAPVWSRVATTYQRDSLKGLGTVRVGDVVSSGGILGAPAAFAGFQRATDFDIDPNLVIFPTLSASGVSQTQSTVDVFVSDVQAARRNLPAGPFTISNLPTLDGQGNVTLVVHDIYGRDHVIVTPFYFSRSLLKPGLSQSSFGAGVLRRDFGTGSGAYGGGVAYGTLRHGYSNNFTGEAHVEESGDVRLVELGGDLVATRLGVFHLAAAQSWSGGRTGIRGLLGYEFASGLRGASAFANVDAQGPHFASLGRSAFGESVTTTAGIHKAFHAGRQLSIAFVNRNQPGGPTTTALSAGYDTPIGSGTWHASLTKAFPGGALGGSVQFALLPGARRSVDGQTNFGSAGNSSRIAAHQSAPPDGFGTGYDLGIGRNPGMELDGSIATRAPFGSAQLTFVQSADRQNSALDVRLLGAVALVDGHLSATDQVTSSYGLVEVAGFPNVRVYNGARLIGRTDRNGRIFISDLVPYEPNEITLDARDLPITVNFDAINATVTPYARNATIIRFKAHSSGGALIRAQDASGVPLPIGTTLTADGGAASWVVANSGTAYLRGARPGMLSILAAGGATTCRMTIAVPVNVAEIPDLGPQTCVAATQAAMSTQQDH